MRDCAIHIQTLMRRFKDAEQAWHVAFDFYRNKAGILTKGQLNTLKVGIRYESTEGVLCPVIIP